MGLEADLAPQSVEASTDEEASSHGEAPAGSAKQPRLAAMAVTITAPIS